VISLEYLWQGCCTNLRVEWAMAGKLVSKMILVLNLGIEEGDLSAAATRGGLMMWERRRRRRRRAAA
jgi:hypothetical protein